MKKVINSLLTCIIIFSSILIFFIFDVKKAEAAIFDIGISRLKKDPDNDNIYYFVGMVYYEVWRNSAGQWTDQGYKPDDTVRLVDGGTYQFTFASNRKVKNITVKPFEFTGSLNNEIFNVSRGGDLEKNPKQYYEKATSKDNSKNVYNDTPVNGLGTNQASKEVFVSNGVLKAKVAPIDRKAEEEKKDRCLLRAYWDSNIFPNPIYHRTGTSRRYGDHSAF